MSTYYAIKGQKVQGLSPEPANLTLGQIWYNTSTQGVRLRTTVGADSWATGNPLNTARYRPGGAGTQTSALAFGGEVPPNNGGQTELYNGSSWTNNPNNMPTGTSGLAGAGTQTAALAFGGSGYPGLTTTQKFDGSSWTTNPNSMLTGVWLLAGCGTQTAALGFGGYFPSTGTPAAGRSDQCQKFNGTTWTTSGSLNDARYNLGGTGTQTSALAFGGASTVNPAITELFNGSSWTTNPSGLTNARSSMKGFGVQTSTIAWGSQSPGAGTTEKFNGSAWTATTTQNILTYQGASAGDTTTGLAFGGKNSSTGNVTGTTEVWYGSAANATITISTT